MPRVIRALGLRFLKPFHRAIRFLFSEPPRIIYDTNNRFASDGTDIYVIMHRFLSIVENERWNEYYELEGY